MRAKEEVELAIKNLEDNEEKGYLSACLKSALKAYECLESDGHSGMSWGITKNYLIRLMNEQPLVPITENDNFIQGSLDDKTEWCDRLCGFYREKQADGTYKYTDMNRYITTNGYTGSFGSAVLEELFPITLPYMPSTKKYILEVEDFDTSGKVGMFDTYALYSITTPSGEKVEVNRFWRESENGWVSIDRKEFDDRKLLHDKAKLLK